VIGRSKITSFSEPFSQRSLKLANKAKVEPKTVQGILRHSKTSSNLVDKLAKSVRLSPKLSLSPDLPYRNLGAREQFG
jgi:hypothetical protein